MNMEDTVNLIEESIDTCATIENRGLFRFSSKERFQIIRLIVQCRLSDAEPYKHELQE